ncbi:hypothetical protein [Thiohalophilus thiocyanatoxydans]|uniref:Uncharacterized protein n=1 Tax=Thiohalophilus thiocyanatoxydans TaxID=381308 RepID=A0A4R8IJQ4_9GAMM|nr:hypothetical protein [Thiohalophilus thiocyanatoxydans]TDY00966.1 hypothetical protein EDC23_1712 [Thiohalophilus thiocyanatoxydans]
MDHVRTLGGSTPRSGRHDRINDDRYFHVMNQGWYALTREGIRGPFIDKQDAEKFVAEHVTGARRDTSRDTEHTRE